MFQLGRHAEGYCAADALSNGCASITAYRNAYCALDPENAVAQYGERRGDYAKCFDASLVRRGEAPV